MNQAVSFLEAAARCSQAESILNRKRAKKMFSKNLSMSIRHLCSSRNLSYEKAAELCGLSPRYFGSVARGQVRASIITLEKLCVGFALTPNELLRIPPLSASRIPMAVMEIRFICGLGCYPVCPHCKLTLDREYQHFCDRCGQELDWKDYSKAIIIFPSRS